MKTQRHKHADLIHAWAEGAEIQYYSDMQMWQDIQKPHWYEKDQYRIKPAAPLIDEETRKAIKKLFPDANWLAMDKDGEAYPFKYKPTLKEITWSDGEPPTLLESLNNYAPDWRTSLVDLNQEVGSGRSTKGNSVDLNKEAK